MPCANRIADCYRTLRISAAASHRNGTRECASERAGRYWDGARSAIHLAHCAARSRRPRDAARIIDRVRQRATAVGAVAILTLADAVAAGDAVAGPLSSRELDVARLVAAGATNREIAEQLVISPKTASSHVKHIVAKLDASRRSEIAAWFTRTQA